MKTNLLLVVIIAILLTSCTPTVPTQEIEVVSYVPSEANFTEVTMTQELVVTPELTATETPTKAPSETAAPSRTPISCVTLLTPLNGTTLPAMGRITFAWDPMNKEPFYILNIILPSGRTVSFETKDPFREQYMEAFSAAGQYQWRVILQDRKRNEICSSELATFSKPAYEQPQPIRDNDNKRK